MSASLTELPVFACWPFEQSKSGFALPVFVHPDNPSIILVQEVDEVSGKVSGFRKLEGADLALMAIFNTAQAVVGDNAIYVFLDDDGSAHVGTSLQLAGLLRQFTLKYPARPSINLQIMELIGSEQEKKKARVEMRQAIIRHAGTNAATSFYNGTLQAVLWNALLREAKNEDVARRILRVRSQISATVENNSLSFDLHAISEEDRATINLASLETTILSEFDLIGTVDANETCTSEPYNQDIEAIQRRVDQVLHVISRCGRQEERIAVLMDSIIADRKIGLSVLLQFGRDRAKLANWTLDQLRQHFFQAQPEPNHLKLFQDRQDTNLDAEQLIAALIPRLFTQQYPLSRGELLFFLAKHLGKWTRVNLAIKRSLDKTASIFVDNWRPAIDAALAQGKASS